MDVTTPVLQDLDPTQQHNDDVDEDRVETTETREKVQDTQQCEDDIESDKEHAALLVASEEYEDKLERGKTNNEEKSKFDEK